MTADQMTEEQSRYKFTVTDVEVKQVQDIGFNELKALGCPDMTDLPNTPASLNDWLEQWNNNQYPEQPYSSNPHGFLITMERI